jgi:hypothetical protein
MSCPEHQQLKENEINAWTLFSHVKDSGEKDRRDRVGVWHQPGGLHNAGLAGHREQCDCGKPVHRRYLGIQRLSVMIIHRRR